MKHVVINVSGKVQGVFFRASTKDMAEKCGVHGFVRNEPDGSVYIEAEGEEESVNQFIDWCRLGPTRARVEKITVVMGQSQGFSGFEIRR